MNHTIRKVLTNKYLIISVAALLLYALAGFIMAPWIIRWYVPKYAEQNLHCRAAVDRVRINPFFLTVEVDRFSLNQADGSPLLAFERFFIDLQSSSLFHWAIVLRELDLDKPAFHLTVEPDGSINFEKLATTPPQTSEPAKSDAQLLPFILQSIAVREGRIAVVDKRQSTPAAFTLQGLDLHLQDLATVKDHNGTYRLAATTEDGGSVQWEGEITFSPIRSKGKLTLKAIPIASLWEFFRDSTYLEQPAGEINASTEYQLNADTPPVQMTLEGLRVSLADLALTLPDTDKALLQLKKLDLDAPRFDLATKELHVAHLLFEEGAVDARIDDSGGMNLQQMIRESWPEKHQGKKTPSSPAPPSGSAAGTDQKVAPPPPATADPPFKVQADAIELKNIAIDLNDKSRMIPVKAAIAGVDLHLQAKLEMAAGENKIVLSEIASALQGISVHGSPSPEPLFATEKLTVEGGKCDLGAHSITFARIAMNKGRLDAGLDTGGTLNWQQLLQTKGTIDKATGAQPAPDPVPAWKFLVKSFEVDGFSSKFSDLTTHSDKAELSSLSAQTKLMPLRYKPVFSLQGVKARLTEVDGKSPMGFTVDFQGEQGGTGTVSGTVNPTIPSVEADVTLAGMVLTSLQPYLEPYVTLILQSAATSTRGRLRYGIPGEAQKADYEGNFSLDNLRLADPAAPKPYLSWEAVQLPNFKLTLQPNGLEAEEIKISKLVGELIVGEDKTLNFAKVLKNQPDGKKTPPPPKPSAKEAKQQPSQDGFAYHIAKVRVENGDMVFADLSLRPRFMTRIHDLKGTVTGLSSVPDAQAKVQLDGHVDQYGMAKISGVIRPSNFGRASDVNMVFRNVEMKNLSPYSGKFAGRLIKTGKISADLKYKLQDYKMTGDNKIVIDNLFLGERIDSPQATDLPLDLAIALLKDASGRIDIGLPVSGDLNDPHFSIGSLIWKMLTNLITNTATAPFRALGNLLGGESENFEGLEFDPGSAELLPPEQEKLLKLAEALKSRPLLKLVIQGRYSPDADGQELKERSIRTLVANQLETKLKPNDNPEPLDFTDSKTQDTLEKLYKERFGKASLSELEKGIEVGEATPRIPPQHQETKSKEAGKLSKMADNMKLYKLIPGGKSREQAVSWAGELYTRLVESEKVADQALLQLAENRSQTVATNLEGEAQIPKERVSIKAPEPLTDNANPSVTLSLDVL